MSVIRNIIFDWSGTLVDDLPAVLRATNFVFEQAGIEAMTLETFRTEFALPFDGFYQRYTPHVSKEQIESWFHRRFEESHECVVELPHAREFLEFCRAAKIRMFLCSTLHGVHFQRQCAVNRIQEYFERCYVGVPDKRQQIKTLLEENGLIPNETIFVGDMGHDIDAAKAGGTWSCGVLTGYNRLEQLRPSKPDLIVEHLGELRDVFQRTGFAMPGPKTNALPALPIATVGALIFNDAGEVLMVRTHKWSDLWGIPGGKIKYAETSEDALRREIEEETALKISGIEFVLVQDCIQSKEFYREAHFILLNYTCRAPGKQTVTLNEEAREYRWLAIDAAFALPLNAPTRILLEAVQRRKSDGHNSH
jgi:phosphoglycolate phosphatase